jgi:hypothetical protein
MITTKFNGRLGNNLFQIATAISLANKLQTEFILPNTTWAGHRGDIAVDLSMFKYDFNRGDIITKHSHVESNFHYDPIELVDDLTIHGFFQSYKYFDNIKNLLIDLYFAPASHIEQSLMKYDISDRSLAISVRRGDYLMLQQNHCVLSTDYYQDIINKYFLEDIDQIYIFSDDIEWCKLVFGNDVHYVRDSIGTQLFLMIKMKHMILSNSTFSWWGAYLNRNNGIIVAPDPWFGHAYSDKKTDDLYVPSWKKEKHNVIKHPYTLTPNMYE